MKCSVFLGWKYRLNVISIIRTANALGFDEVILTGKKKLFSNKLIQCTKYFDSTIRMFDEPEEVVAYLKEKKYNLVSMELTPNAKNIVDFKWVKNPAIIVGHETYGIPEDILKISKQIMLPMQGKVTCMNVSTASAIAMYDHFTKTR